ncbi:protein-tyrosine phosphatase, partial [Chytriomyces sp. MP71]
PDLFGHVESGVFRCSAVVETPSLPFLRALHLASVLVLTPELASRPLLALVEEQGIRLNHIANKPAIRAHTQTTSAGIVGNAQNWKYLSDEVVKEGLEFVLQAANHPVLIVCTSGIHETGAFVGCLRRMLGWNFNSIVVEYRCFAGSKSRYLIQQFIELFDTDLIRLPRHQDLPFWFQEYLLSQAEAEEERSNILVSRIGIN